ncbi:hypothetical protein HanPI659440_Chr17g0669441 [Helianthus annuus]|nr:hypothetical protein HanPI659440_Chr17g0669441 [Helianthus annuus]
MMKAEKASVKEKVPTLRKRKDHKAEVKHLYRRFGDMERAHVQALLYQALPAVENPVREDDMEFDIFVKVIWFLLRVLTDDGD